MRLSEILGAEVVDADGHAVGRVRDARLVQDGPIQGTFGAGLRLAGLIVGPIAIGSRLGFTRTGVRSPWLVARIVDRLEHGTRYVPWADVESIEDRTVTLSCRSAELERPAPIAFRGGPR